MTDPYVKEAQKCGYRSRAAFKLLEIHEKDQIFRRRMKVVDLGAAPGGWSQIIAELVGDEGEIFALDLLPIDPLTGVTFLQGDFTQDEIYNQFLTLLSGQKVDAVVSDMAPNISGLKAVDQPRSYYLAELALDFAGKALKKDGVFLVKVFQGEGFDEYLKGLRKVFKTVKIRKPKSSRPRSKELYLLAMGYIG
ncbi:MAG: 23S rRNA (uridine(2552)-2'-O)-methyltransferase RlmE [Gammaproteobacteria bacterium]|nr:23S rRNA (uridine(2552)-2'-O)-methyltransferase RlmE [Gammaproteobacteria bacterium]